MARIGFIGLGNMGGGMALNLVKAGHEVIAFDLADSALARARDGGCTIVAAAGEACLGADAVITMLPAGTHVAAVYGDQLFAAATPGTLLVDCSTIDVATARAVAATASDRGFAMVDAPVSGGIAAAQAGTLTFMVGGPDAAFARAAPILAQMGKAVIHAGAAGDGQAAKICNNMILGSQMIATCEALALALRLGLDPQKFYDIASQASGQSWSLTSYCPLPGVGPQSPADRGYEGGFAAGLMLKDLKLAMVAAQGVDAAVPMGAAAAALYQAFVNAGAGARDFSAIIAMLDGRQPGRTAL
ncbi:3-hydroxyisobutyrate dehydrogenase [Sphingomonas abietis]|uniref:3-hydroxyisobutyrate dehydrogenase n=1 Tax=Sphingomonas abietis TaxID=3012344 RepID=A0ABY7NQZ4_9SPHN|nr:3-hydroxyisobutyrate dehydrogenase [Sphingomonas abietis]WBO22972.1 3-hydroxyisobutyrate dehydrogenase [Sphingomonas abietis]